MSVLSQILVGIVTRNRANVLPKALKSALRQSVPNLHVAVIDDGSTDSTNQLSVEFPTVAWDRREVGKGYMSARNELMSRPGFDFYVSLDDDAWFLCEDEIAVAVRYLEEHANVGAVGFDILSPDRPDRRERGAAQTVSMFIGCGHVLRLGAVHKVGGYESTPGAYGGEEKDLCLRLMDAGYSIVRLPGLHVWHDKTPVARELAQQHRSGVCNDLVITLKRAPLLVLPFAIPAKMVRHLRFSCRSRLLRPCLSGFLLFVVSCRNIWQSRRAVKLGTLRNYMRLSRD